jgi:FKBP-type peptidyl-prolyl cis-trans isomerase
MKQTALVFCLFLAGLQAHAMGIREDINMEGDKARTSYAFGMTVGLDLAESGLELDYAAFAEGLVTSMQENGVTMMDKDEAMDIVQAAFSAAAQKQAEDLQKAEELFLAENAGKEGVTVTQSGLQYVVLEKGSGPVPAAGDTVSVNYEGTLIDGTVFDSSIERGEPETIPLDMVIPGWSEAIQLMNVGGKYLFYIPSELAYGPQGAGRIIPPFSTLVFTIELLSIVDPEGEL